MFITFSNQTFATKREDSTLLIRKANTGDETDSGLCPMADMLNFQISFLFLLFL
jgi:hypothetical protein